MASPLFQQWFRLADEDGDGMVGGMEAVKFFQRSGLPLDVLGEIWDFSSSGSAKLNLMQFCSAIRLVSLAQGNGQRLPREQARAVVSGAGPNLPPPKLQGLDSGHGYVSQMTGAPLTSSYMPQVTGMVQPGYSAQMTGFSQPGFPQPGYTPQMTGPRPGYTPQMTGPAAYSMQMTGAAATVYPPVVPADIQRYKSLFAQMDSDADNYVQGGEVAGHFLPSGLDKTVLRDIWEAVAGTSGKLTEEQFVKFNYLVEVSKKGVPVPKQLPPGPFPPVNTASTAAMALSSAPRPAAMPMPAAPGGAPTGASWNLRSQFGNQGMQAAMDTAYNMNVQMPGLPARVDVGDITAAPYQSRVPAVSDNLLSGLKPNDRSKLEETLQEAEVNDRKLWTVEQENDAAKKRSEQYQKALSELAMFKSRTDVALLQAQDQANRLQQEAASLEKQYQAAYSGADTQYSKGNSIREHIQKLVHQKQEAQSKANNIQLELQSISQMGPEEMQRLEAEVQVLVEGVMSLESKRAAWEIQMEGARQQKELLQKKMADLQMATAASEAELDGCKKDVRELMNKVETARSSSDLRMVQSLLIKASSAYKALYHHAQTGGLEIPYEAQLSNVGVFMWSEDVLAGAADWMDNDTINNKGFVMVNAFPDLDSLPPATGPVPHIPPKLPTPTAESMGLQGTSMFSGQVDPISLLKPLAPPSKPSPQRTSTSGMSTGFGDSAFGGANNGFGDAFGATPAQPPAAAAAFPSFGGGKGFDDNAF